MIAAIVRFWVWFRCWVLGHRFGDTCYALTPGMHVAMCERCQGSRLRHWGGRNGACKMADGTRSAGPGVPSP